MFADLQDFLIIFYREILFAALAFLIVAACFLAVTTVIRAIDQR